MLLDPPRRLAAATALADYWPEIAALLAEEGHAIVEMRFLPDELCFQLFERIQHAVPVSGRC